MKIFITGISGFIGANLASTLMKRGEEVHGLIRRNSKNHWRLAPIESHIHLHEGDILDYEVIQRIVQKIKPEIIYHLAVYGAYPHQQDPDLMLRSSVMATLHLLEAAYATGVKIFINAGSSSEYGHKNHPMREEELPEPNSYYAVGKVAQSLLCNFFSAQKKLPIITLRPFSVYGPYEEPRRFLPTIILNALAGKDIPLASPDTARDFIYIDDAVEAFILASQRPDLGSQIFNVGSGRQETLQTSIQTIMDITKSSSRLLWNVYPPRPFDTTVWVADTTKSENILRFHATTSLKLGIEKTVHWLKNNTRYYQ